MACEWGSNILWQCGDCNLFLSFQYPPFRPWGWSLVQGVHRWLLFPLTTIQPFYLETRCLVYRIHDCLVLQSRKMHSWGSHAYDVSEYWLQIPFLAIICRTSFSKFINWLHYLPPTSVSGLASIGELWSGREFWRFSWFLLLKYPSCISSTCDRVGFGRSC